MKKILPFVRAALVIIVIGFILHACSKGGGSGYGSNPCNGVTIAINTTVVNTNSGGNTGSIAATASGGAGPYTYSINGAAYQSSGTFSNLGKGTYTIGSKDSKGCSGSVSAVVGENSTCAATITVATATAASDPCTASGTITVTASGGSGALSYQLDGGTAQGSNIFQNVSAGTHAIVVKDAGACSTNASANVSALSAGTNFAAVKSVIQGSCAVAGCHTGGASAAAGIDFSVDCNIVARGAAIKVRAVDGAGTANQMPQPPRAPLSPADRDKITAWLAAGGKYSN